MNKITRIKKVKLDRIISRKVLMFYEYLFFSDDCPILFSESLRTKAAMPPNPPSVTAEIVGMEERVQLEETLHHLISRRDRLACLELVLVW